MTGFIWRLFEGRDKDGDRFAHHVLIHGSGRIVAKIYAPCQYDAYNFEVSYFFGGAEGKALDEGAGAARFIDLESAMLFCEATIGEPRLIEIVNADAAKVRQLSTA